MNLERPRSVDVEGVRLTGVDVEVHAAGGVNVHPTSTALPYLEGGGSGRVDGGTAVVCVTKGDVA